MTQSSPHPKKTQTRLQHRAPEKSDTRPLIVCFGDSLTEGHGTEAGQSYPDYLQAALDAQGYHYRVVNEGISGNTTKDGVDRLDRIVAMKPAIVVVEFGGNDGLRGLRIEDTRANLDKIVATLKASEIPIVLAGITLPPTTAPTTSQASTQPTPYSPKNIASPCCPFFSRASSASPA